MPQEKLGEIVEALLKGLEEDEDHIDRNFPLAYLKAIGALRKLIPIDKLDKILMALLQGLKDTEDNVQVVSAEVLGACDRQFRLGLYFTAESWDSSSELC